MKQVVSWTVMIFLICKYSLERERERERERWRLNTEWPTSWNIRKYEKVFVNVRCGIWLSCRYLRHHCLTIFCAQPFGRSFQLNVCLLFYNHCSQQLLPSETWLHQKRFNVNLDFAALMPWAEQKSSYHSTLNQKQYTTSTTWSVT